MVSLTPFFWFDTEALESVQFYVSLFPNSTIISKDRMQNTPSGSVDLIKFILLKNEFSFMSAGPFHKFNPSISFSFITNNKKFTDLIWKKLSDAGSILMEYSDYSFAEKFGWVQDKYGVSWQIQYSNNVNSGRIFPSLLFVGKNCGRAEEALHFYTEVFSNSKINEIVRYSEIETPDKPGTIKHASFVIENREFSMTESAFEHKFFFNESMSFVINCDSQSEIDYYWENYPLILRLSNAAG